jgi:hypothetical protein
MLSQDFSSLSDSRSEQWLDNHPELIADLLFAVGFMVIILIVTIVMAIIVSLFSFLGMVRFARTRTISEGFNFSEILAQIRRIGWINYIIALITITVIGYIFGMILNFFSLIPVVGIFVELLVMGLLYVPFILFSARFSTLVYEAGEKKSLQVPGTD